MTTTPALRSFAAPTAIVASLALLALTGCASYVPFTQELRQEHNLTAADLSNLQFYNSHEITLRRELARGDSQITGAHKLLLIAGKQIEEVVIDQHTPGVVVGVGESVLRVSFEEGTYLEFSVRGAEPIREPLVPQGDFAEPPDPFPGNSATPARREPVSFVGSGNYWLLPFDGAPIPFQGKSYESVGESNQAHLVISTESLEQVEEDRRVLKGRTL